MPKATDIEPGKEYLLKSKVVVVKRTDDGGTTWWIKMGDFPPFQCLATDLQEIAPQSNSSSE